LFGMVFVRAIKCLAIGVAVLPLGGCAIGVGLIFANLMLAEAYCPELSSVLFGRAMLGFALVESFMFLIVASVGVIFVF